MKIFFFFFFLFFFFFFPPSHSFYWGTGGFNHPDWSALAQQLKFFQPTRLRD